MSKSGPKYLKMETTDINEHNIKKVAAIFPNEIN